MTGVTGDGAAAGEPGAPSPEEPRERSVRANGVRLCCFEWGWAHEGRGPTLLLAHATGFHARCWDPVVRRLPGVHVVAVDQRSHGRSENAEITHWGELGRDLADLVRVLDLRGIVGVGHSMGGHALVEAAVLAPGRFRRLVLLDPVIAAPDQYGGGGWTLRMPDGEPHPTAKRKRHFESPEEMIERFRERPPYDVFVPEALEAYCRYGLLPVSGGPGFELACPPEREASVYMTSRTNAGIHERVRALEIPVLVVRARLPPADRSLMDFSSSPTWPALASEFAHGRDLHWEDHSHFLPMEAPGAVADVIRQELRAEEASRSEAPAPAPRG